MTFHDILKRRRRGQTRRQRKAARERTRAERLNRVLLAGLERLRRSINRYDAEVMGLVLTAHASQWAKDHGMPGPVTVTIDSGSVP